MQTRSIVDLPSILRSNLFGQAAAPGGADAPLTSMALVLSGTIADVDEKRGFAILGPSATAMKVYSVGDTLPGGARLHAVLVDRVLLDRGGTIESLLLPKRTGTGPVAVAAAGAPSAMGAAERVQQLVRANPSHSRRDPAPAGGDRGRQAARLPGLSGTQRGGLQPPWPAARRPGDRHQWHRRWTIRQRSTEIFNSLGSVAEARITVVRNGSQQDLLLNLAEVANEAEQLARSPAAASRNGAPPPPGMLPAQAPLAPANAPESSR